VKRRVRGEPAGYELGEEPYALRFAGLALREQPERSEYAQGGARHPHQQLVGISDEARQRRHPEPLPHRDDLRLGVRGFERNLRGGNLTLARPVGDAKVALRDPPDGIGRSRTPRGGGPDQAPTGDGDKVANVIPVDYVVQLCTARCLSKTLSNTIDSITPCRVSAQGVCPVGRLASPNCLRRGRGSARSSRFRPMSIT
jgi:hypothetical protein